MQEIAKAKTFFTSHHFKLQQEEEKTKARQIEKLFVQRNALKDKTWWMMWSENFRSDAGEVDEEKLSKSLTKL